MAQAWPIIAKILATKIAGTTIGSIIGSIAASVLSSLAVRALTPRPKGGLTATSPLQMQRDPSPIRRVIYGRTRVSGPLVYTFAGQTGSENHDLHVVILLASHQVAEIGNIWLNDEEIYLSGSEPVSGDLYKDHLWVYKKLGTADQTAHSELITNSSGEWTSTDRLRGIANIYVKLYATPDDEERFTGGFPNISADVKGKPCYDPRDETHDPDDASTWEFSDNPAICLLDYLTNTDFGLGFSLSEEIDTDSFCAAANDCDDWVPSTNGFSLVGDVVNGSATIQLASGETTADLWPGMHVGGTGIPDGARVDVVGDTWFTMTLAANQDASSAELVFGEGEWRYRLGGCFDLDVEPVDVIRQILATMAGLLVYAGGRWRLTAGVAQAATEHFTAEDLRGSMSVRTRDSIRDTCNIVRGTYTYPGDAYNRREFPAVENAAYIAEDGGYEIPRELDLPWVQRPGQAQRLAKIELETARQDITVTSEEFLGALRVQPGDIITRDSALDGWTAKKFRVTGWRFVVNPDNTIGIDLETREYAPEIYDWSIEDTAVDPAPNSTLPDRYNAISQPAGA